MSITSKSVSSFKMIDRALSKIGRSECGKYFRVYDIISVVKQNKNENTLESSWKRMKKAYPEFGVACTKLKVVPHRQKQDVCDFETALEIIWCCTGKTAREFARVCATKLAQLYRGVGRNNCNPLIKCRHNKKKIYSQCSFYFKRVFAL